MDGLIYVVGGGDGKDWLCSAEVHTPTHYWSPRSIPWKCQNTWILKVYDPKKNVWRSIADLSAKRWKCGLGKDLADAHFSMILVLLILYIHVDCFSGAWRVFICSRWNGLSPCWILGRSSQYWSLYIILIIILSFTFSIVIVLILQSSATVHGPMSGRQ